MGLYLKVSSLLGLTDLTDLPEQNYRILVPGERYEMRWYEKLFIAKLSFEGSFEKAKHTGLQILGEYFHGENFKQKRLKPKGGAYLFRKADHWDVCMPLPSGFGHANHPRPIDERIRFAELPARKMVVIKFEGVINELIFHHKQIELERWLIEKNLSHEVPAMISISPERKLLLKKKHELHLAVSC